jgi:hypothetical protein
MRRGQRIFTTLDLYLASFLSLHGIEPKFEFQGSRVVFVFPVSDELYKLSGRFNANANIPVCDFVQKVKELRSQMITIRNEKQRLDIPTVTS